MKRNVKMTGLLWSLLFVLGGMFLTVESTAQTTVAQYHANAPAGKSWINPSQANATVTQKISLATLNVNNLVQAGADEQAIRLAKMELLLWLNIQEYLNAGLPVGTAVETAFAKLSAGNGALKSSTNDPKKQAQMDLWYSQAITLLTI